MNRRRGFAKGFAIVRDGFVMQLRARHLFPFKARCIAPRTLSPLTKGEEVDVLSMAHADDCMREMFVLVGFGGRKLGVPLSQLEPVAPKGGTREASEDWRYWVAMGYEF